MNKRLASTKWVKSPYNSLIINHIQEWRYLIKPPLSLHYVNLGVEAKWRLQELPPLL